MLPLETVKKVANTSGGSYAMLVGGLLVAAGPWLIALDAWGDALAPANLGILLPIIGGVLMAWLGKSPGTK